MLLVLLSSIIVGRRVKSRNEAGTLNKLPLPRSSISDYRQRLGPSG